MNGTAGLYFFPGNACHVLPGIVYYRFSRDRVCRLSQVWDRLVRGANERSERRDEDRNSKRLKNIVSFTRRYLGNEELYRDKLKTVLKRQAFNDRSFI